MKFPKLKSKLILAPMLGYSDIAFRMLCRKYGAGMCFTEMISADAVVKGNFKVKLDKKDRPIALQLFGNDAETMLKAARKFEKEVDVIDVNMGCPSGKTMSAGYGADLLKDKKRIKKIISCLVKGLKIPVSIKVRKCENLMEIVKIAEKEGASAITIHGRTIKQGYSGKADWGIIKKIKKSVSMAIIGNGDVSLPEYADRMMKETGCDYVMIGRSTLKNPQIFEGMEHCDGKKIFSEYLKLAKKYGTDAITIKNHAVFFTKGMMGGARIRGKLNMCKNTEDIEMLFSGLGNL